MRVLKGHGTGNDFVVLPDLDDDLTLTPQLVRALCDRRTGLGADGVLRVVRSTGGAPFFMDYRNADGSIAEMCGNGVRVFVRYLQHARLADGRVAIDTRAGVRQTWTRDGVDGEITVDMGAPQPLDMRPLVTAGGLAAPVAGHAVEMPNPHVVVRLPEPAAVADLNLATPPHVDPPLPHGQNVEFVARVGPRHLVMRVFERGVGETRSCGTGICAAVAATVAEEGGVLDGQPWRVDIPGGTCTVHWPRPDSILLTGPAVLVADIDIDDAWLAAARHGEDAAEHLVARP